MLTPRDGSLVLVSNRPWHDPAELAQAMASNRTNEFLDMSIKMPASSL